METFLQRILESLSRKEQQYEIVHLSSLKVKDCIHCNFCLTKQTEGKYCSLKDDAQAIMEKAESSDIIVLASPVYFMRSSARMASLVNRLRVFILGNTTAGRLKNKIGVSMAVSWLRQGGLETTHLAHITAFLTLGMIPASVHKGLSPLGASAYASIQGLGQFDPQVTMGIENDEPGMASAELIMRRALELAKLVKK